MLCNISNIYKSREGNEFYALFIQLQLLTHGRYFLPPLQLFGANPRRKILLIKTKTNSRGFSILLKPASAVRPHGYYFIFWIKCLMFSFSFMLYYILFMKDLLGKNVQRPRNLFCFYRLTFLMLMPDDWLDKFFQKRQKMGKSKVESRKKNDKSNKSITICICKKQRTDLQGRH